MDKVSVITQQAKLLAKEKKFKSSIEKYSEAELLLMKLLNTNSKNRYLSELGTEKIKILERKNSEDQVFKIQLLKATENYNLGRKGYAKAKIILMTDPMQSRVNEPEVIALKDKISKMEAYFVMKDAAYRLVNSKKKNAEAIISLLKTQEFAFLSPKIVPVNEFSQLEKSIDSLQFLINPKIIIEKTPIVSPASTCCPSTTSHETNLPVIWLLIVCGRCPGIKAVTLPLPVTVCTQGTAKRRIIRSINNAIKT